MVIFTSTIKFFPMKNLLFIALISLTFSVTRMAAQIDSIHIQIQDTVLKAGTFYTAKFKLKESIENAEGFQFCIGYDPANLTYQYFEKFYIPGLDSSFAESSPRGLKGYLSVIFYAFAEPYTGKNLMDVRFKVNNDCKVKDVLSILPIYRFGSSGSFFSSEMYLKNGSTLPIATEYLPAKTTAIKHSQLTLQADVFPNPMKGQATLQFNSTVSGETALTVYDVRGNKVNTKSIRVQAGANSIQLDHSLISIPGQYTLVIELGETVVRTKLQVQ